MSQNRTARDELKYLERFALDVRKIGDRISSKSLPRTYDQACDDIFKYVRDHLSSKIDLVRESSPELADTLTAFSNEALSVVLEVKRAESQRAYGLSQQSSLIEEILASTVKSTASLQAAIENNKGEKSSVDSVLKAPPVRERPRTPGDHPGPRIATKRNQEQE